MRKYGHPIPAYGLHILLIILFSPLIKVAAQPVKPQLNPFQPVTVKQSPATGPLQPLFPGQVNPLHPNDPYRAQNLRLMEQGGMDIPFQPASTRQQQITDLRETLQEEAKE